MSLSELSLLTVHHEDLSRLVKEIYIAAGTPADRAEIVSRHQVGSNLAGHESHGVQLLPQYIDRIDLGHIVPTAEPEIVRETPTSLFVNGHWGFGSVVTEWTAERTIAKARESGVAVASIREQSHVGRLADYPLMASRAGLIGMVMCDSGQTPKQVAPFGGRVPRLGTNPLSISLPSNLEAPFSLDMATSAAAMAKLKVARTREKPVPVGWLLDAEGNPTTDPNDFFAGGAMLPLGGAEGHKGYGLSVVVETLAAVLPGLGFGIDPLGRHNDGLFLLVVDPSIIRSGDEFKQDVEDFMAYLKDTPTANGFNEVLYPGELEHRNTQIRLRDGIPMDEPTWKALGEVSARFGLTMPSPKDLGRSA